jgi:geranylgeranyl pyrophosphate synthase
VVAAARRIVEAGNLTPPMPLSRLERLCGKVLREASAPADCRPYAMIALNNALWRPELAAVPCDRRLLLMPKCLRHPTACVGRIDEYGLLCGGCGRCVLHTLQAEAEQLGYVVMIAEGSAVVMRLIETGQVEGIVGVSCLDSLQRVFPYMEAAAVPGLAIPLLYDGCRQTAMDVDHVRDALYLTSRTRRSALPIERIRRHIDRWFSPEGLVETFGPAGSLTETAVQDFLARGGKRWRPFLACCAAMALADDPADRPLPEGLRELAVAVECFHKASLIHDDIEDGDPVRYGRAAMHAEYGPEFAINAGDFLLGEGYRMIGACRVEAPKQARLFAIAAEGHRMLALGQGAELAWTRQPEPLAVESVLEIFRSKTAPAFEVALRMGAVFALGDDHLGPALRRYCQALGAAYQIRDDLDDFYAAGDSDDLAAGRLSILPALAAEALPDQAGQIHALWTDRQEPASLRGLIEQARAPLEAMRWMERQKDRAIAALADVRSTPLKALLRRVVGKIFYDLEYMECCDDHANADARRRRSGQTPPA